MRNSKPDKKWYNSRGHVLVKVVIQQFLIHSRVFLRSPLMDDEKCKNLYAAVIIVVMYDGVPTLRRIGRS